MQYIFNVKEGIHEYIKLGRRYSFLLHQLKDAITQNAIKLFIFVNTVSMKDTFIQVSLKVE